RQDDRLNVVQLAVGVPEAYRGGAGPGDRPDRVPVVERPRERHHADDRLHPTAPTSADSTRIVNSSITGLARRVSAIRRACSSAAGPTKSISIRLPIRTEDTPVTPSRGSAFATA